MGRRTATNPYFQSDAVTIYHADCREILADLPPVDYVITDPPYAMGSSRQEWKVTASVGTGIHMAARKIVKGGALFCFSTTSGRGVEYTLGAVGRVLPFNRILIWHKRFVRSRVAGPWRWDTVAVLAFGRASFGKPEVSSCCVTDGSVSKLSLGDTGHPAEVPSSVAHWLYCPLDREGITLLDPFMGSGSLLLPAVASGRRVIGIEAEERYCEVAAKRLQMQGGKEKIRPDEPDCALHCLPFEDAQI